MITHGSCNMLCYSMSEGNPAIRLIQHKNSQLLNAVQDGDLNLVLRWVTP